MRTRVYIYEMNLVFIHMTYGVKQKCDIKLSKRLSYLLRHGAVRNGLSIKSNGFVPVNELLSKSLREYKVEDIIRVVETNDKKRFCLRTNDGVLEIKANQGHSISSINNLNLKRVEHANFDIIHGTYFDKWNKMKVEGLSRMKRNHIHFAKGLNFICGLRQSAEIYIYIDFEKAVKDGLTFYESENGVILCEGDAQGYIATKYFLKGHDKFKVADSSIFVSSLPKGCTESQIVEFFGTFGKVKNHTFKQTYAIIQFEDTDVVNAILRKHVVFQDKKLNVTRRLRFHNDKGEQHENKKQISHDQLYVMFDKQLTFDQQFSQFLNAIQLSDADLRERYHPVCAYLDRIFSGIFPMCRSYMFGSTSTGLAFKESDLDIYMDVGFNKQSTMEKEFKIVKKIMYKRREIFYNVIPIPRAKIPIIKFYYAPTSVDCDISFKHGFGVWNSSIIRYYLSLDTRLKPLMMLIKYWATHLQICGTGKISSYALIMLIIFFLQQPSIKIIPPLTELRKKCHPIIVNGWQINFDVNPELPVITNTMSIPELLQEFLTFYGDFNFENNVICPLNGMVIPAQDFVESIYNLPPCMKSYTDFISMKDPTTLLHVKRPICVQDPIELNHNITAYTTPRILHYFEAYCKIGEKICMSARDNNYSDFLNALFTISIKQKKTRNTVALDTGLYLEISIPESSKSRTDAPDEEDVMNKKWYFIIFNIIKDFFEKVMLMDVEVSCIDNEAKQQKIETLSDVHTKDHCKLKLDCRGSKCMWRCRQKCKINILDPSLSVLEKEIIRSKRLLEEASNKKENRPLNLKFVCMLKKNENPRCTVLHIQDAGSDRGIIKECYEYLKSTIPKTVNTTFLHIQQFKKYN